MRQYLKQSHDGCRTPIQQDGKHFEAGPVFDMTTLSDEAVDFGLTGTFVGMFAQDLWNKYADFDFFEYIEG